jgi:hypothetical protein
MAGQAPHSAIAVLEKIDNNLRLVSLKELPLETFYTAVVGSVRRLNEAYAFEAGCLDKTGVGEGPYEEIRQFMRGMEGVTLTAQVKEDHVNLNVPKGEIYRKQ